MQEDIHYYVKLCVSRDGGSRSSFGPGTAQLLRGIRDSGSLNRATKAMGMAYSKAWHVLNTAEEQLGIKLVERNGANGSELTEDGKRFLILYDQILAKTTQVAGEMLAQSGILD